jgi:hypothetical protein
VANPSFLQPTISNNADHQSTPSSETSRSERHHGANAIRANHNPEGPPEPESDKVAIFDGHNDSDFDGEVMPCPVKDASRLPNLIHSLCAHGFNDATISKITFDNWMRVFRPSWY